MIEIAILMTTYNSSEYLREQLDSLISQTLTCWELFVRDDQSQDDTVEILNSYAKRDKRIHYVQDREKRGAKDGFLWLLGQTEAKYYMFCDHDDVWLPRKIELEYQAIEQCADKETVPIIICTDLSMVDKRLGMIRKSSWKFNHYGKKSFNDKYYHLCYNNVTGCTMLLNNKAKSASFPCPQEAMMHDSWISAAVLWAGGKIIAIEEPTMLYRQHGHNTIGFHKVPSLWNQAAALKRLFKKVNRQYRASRSLTNIPRLAFWAMKTYYMATIHIKATFQ